jgi:hypothetical protein
VPAPQAVYCCFASGKDRTPFSESCNLTIGLPPTVTGCGRARSFGSAPARRADCSNGDCPRVRVREIARISASADHVAADLAADGCSHTSTVNHVHTRAACLADLCDRAVRLMKRRAGHGLRRCCDGQSKDDRDQPDHSLLLCEPSRRVFLEGC